MSLFSTNMAISETMLQQRFASLPLLSFTLLHSCLPDLPSADHHTLLSIIFTDLLTYFLHALAESSNHT